MTGIRGWYKTHPNAFMLGRDGRVLLSQPLPSVALQETITRTSAGSHTSAIAGSGQGSAGSAPGQTNSQSPLNLTELWVW